MSFFLRSHVANLGTHRVPVSQHGQLAGINPLCAIFPGLIHPEHNIFFRAVHGLGLRCINRIAIIAAPVSENRALYPASEMPANVHCGVSHRMIGALRIASNDVPAAVVVQLVMPGHQPYSTPA